MKCCEAEGEEGGWTEGTMIQFNISKLTTNTTDLTISNVVGRTTCHQGLTMSQCWILTGCFAIHNHWSERDNCHSRTHWILSCDSEGLVCYFGLEGSWQNTCGCIENKIIREERLNSVTIHQSIHCRSERLFFLVDNGYTVPSSIAKIRRSIKSTLVLFYGTQCQIVLTQSIYGTTVSILTRTEWLTTDKGSRISILSFTNGDGWMTTHIDLTNLNTLTRRTPHLHTIHVIRLIIINIKLLVTTIRTTRPHCCSRTKSYPFLSIIRSLKDKIAWISGISISRIHSHVIQILMTMIVVGPL